ncbi:MAG: AAA family ATPase [Cyanosarcina radialis HA8281-LM2]|jgi:predicted ATPase/GAF domain-containing protein/tRNA A-37 threonylcarbamoyl transferase component Bud32|nr:AAA family ATPase [Cyanosarcina radialis HA8281-LM2]
MITIPGYQTVAQIYQSANSLVYRALREHDEQKVILKLLRQDYPTPAELTRYKQEYEITHDLKLAGAIEAYSLEKYQNTLVIVFEDFGGESLRMWCDRQKLDIKAFLRVAIKITEALGNIHDRHIIHKDINPSNIVFNATTGQLKIIDFGISTVLTQENPIFKNPQVLEGTLAYVSPEQTGRMNRFLDYRTDFYSLGVTFYELLTNQLPFTATDPLELVHCHIAKQPIPPHLALEEENCPQPISQIVMKLMAKTAEERYQSAWGIQADLVECLAQLEDCGQISQIDLGAEDIANKFQIPQKLYGREREIEKLLAAFDRVIGVEEEQSKIQNPKSKIQVMLISGYSGIGKSALVKQIYQPVTQCQGYFISGKFDQYQRDIPYYAVVQALRELVKQLLTETESQIKTWRDKLQAALGTNGRVVVEAIPELELIIGEQPSIPELPGQEAQNRFNLVFQNFISAIARPEHPLVIFIDDLQWADLASLKLMQLLVNASEIRSLFLIGAYRDNEVSAVHPLMLTLEEMKQAGVAIDSISLSPLTLEDTNRLLSDALKSSPEMTRSLAELVHVKTGGNPFFLREFLESLVDEKSIEFDLKTRKWLWDIEQIKRRSFTDNVVELMSNKIQRLSSPTQEVLKLAACIGNQFELRHLAIVLERSLQSIALLLREAMQDDLVLPLSANHKFVELVSEAESARLITNNQQSTIVSYKFVHDRIQQAAYALIPEEGKPDLHLKIGRLLWQNTSSEEQEEKIFDIVNQMNFAIERIDSESERERLAQLNLIAGNKAIRSAAYGSALKYLQVGQELIPKNSWVNYYELTLNLFNSAAESAYLTGDFERMDNLVRVILKEAVTLLDRVKAYEIEIRAYIAQNNLLQAATTGLRLLKLWGISFPKNPNQLDVLLALIKTKLILVGKTPTSLLDLPTMTDFNKISAMKILALITPAVYSTIPTLLPLLILKQVNLSVKYGNTSISAYTYASYGVILCGIVGDVETGYEFGQLALKMVSKSNIQEIKARTLLAINGFIKHRKEHLNRIFKPLLEAYQTGLETGEWDSAAICLTFCCSTYLMLGNDLKSLDREIVEYINKVTQIQQLTYLTYLKLDRQFVLNLMGMSKLPWQLKGKAYDEEFMSMRSLELDNKSTTFHFNFNKTLLYYLFGQYDRAIASAELAKKYSTLGISGVAILSLYDSLARLAIYQDSEKTQQKILLRQVQANQKKLKKWADDAPMNFLHKFYLVEAERYRVLGKYAEAIDSYDRAINLAHENEYLNEEALAYELAAKFYLAKGNIKVAETYMRQARYCYLKWGAMAKVKDLDTKYPELLSTISQPPTTSETTQRQLTTTGKTSQQLLDLNTLIKTSKALSQETDLDKLLSDLMKFAIENAGAERGFLLLAKDKQLTVETEGSIDLGITTERSPTIQTNDRLSTTIINYVYRTQENLVLSDASAMGLFTNDDYIKTHQIKSVLCLPILSQGKAIGILYLENNLAVNAFTDERLEILKLISSQAAISLENALLRQTEKTADFEYQVGGCLTTDAPTYVIRQADIDLDRNLKTGHFCYILNSRHMGKSSLRVRATNRLQAEGIICASVDLTSIGSKNISVEQWYAGVIYSLVNSLQLTDKFDFRSWWRSLDFLSPVQKFSEFIQQIVLREISGKIVIFIDEIDSTLGLNANMDDFFAAIRACYNYRAENPEYKRLTFVLLGVASPSSLVQDKNCTPFNIGTAIALQGFQLHEVQPLMQGIAAKAINAQAVLQEVLAWTGGQPFLTQKICNLIVESQTPILEGKEAQWVADLIQTEVIENWEAKDDPEHLKTIRNRLLKSESSAPRLLELYGQILERGEIAADDSPEQMELLLSGLVIKQPGRLKVYNRIYQTVFDRDWIANNYLV